MFKPTYLYIKTHNKTGLKYFGKTIKNPFKYRGSGLHWTRHLKAHGNDVTTEIVGLFTDEKECITAALEFSEAHNITLSEEWANLKPENGLDGGLSTVVAVKIKKTLLEKYGAGYYRNIASQNTNRHSEEVKKKISESVKKNFQKFGCPSLGKVRQKVQCPHCDKSGAMNTMSRFHFDKCKFFKE